MSTWFRFFPIDQVRRVAIFIYPPNVHSTHVISIHSETCPPCHWTVKRANCRPSRRMPCTMLLLGRCFHLIEQQTNVNMDALRKRVKSIFHAIRHYSRAIPDIDYFGPQPDDLVPSRRGKSSYEVAPCAEQVHDIYHITFLLQQKLISDVIPAILEYADLYSSTTSTTELFPTLEISQLEAPARLIECEIAKVKTRILKPVRKITFKITSHDQGFAVDHDGGSYTWFTAQKSLPETTLLPGSMLASDARNEVEYDCYHRKICSNVVASLSFRSHEITWRADSRDPGEAKWVSSFVAGDRFAVYAWANYPAWVNHVCEVSVTVHYVAVI